MRGRGSLSRRALLVCGLFLVELGAPWTSSAELTGEVQALLASPDPDRWLDAVERLAKMDDVPSLLRLLREDPRKVVRTAAGLVLAGFQERRVLEALGQALDDPEQWVRLVAVEALAFLGGEEVNGPLRRALQDQDPEVRTAAREALDQLGRDREVPFSTVDRGVTSGIKEAGFFVLRTEEEWQRFWRRHASSDPPVVDFSREMVIAAFMGEQRTGGFSIEIQKVEDKGGLLKVLVQKTLPAPESPVLQVLTQPYHIIKLAKTELPVRFARRSLKEKR